MKTSFENATKRNVALKHGGAHAAPPCLPPAPGSSLPHVIKQEKREPGGNWAPSVGFGSPALPPNADPTDRPTDRRTDRGREQVPVGFCLSRKEAKLNWLKNDGTAAAGASSPLLKTHFQSDLIKTAGGRARSGRANIHNLYMRVKGGRHATVLGEPRGALVAGITY